MTYATLHNKILGLFGMFSKAINKNRFLDFKLISAKLYNKIIHNTNCTSFNFKMYPNLIGHFQVMVN